MLIRAAISLDVTDLNSLRTTFARIEQSLGSVDCLVNAAGIGTGGPFLECDPATVNNIFGINVRRHTPLAP